MIILLPPSESKSDGGDEGVLDFSSLTFPALTHTRTVLVSALVSLCQNQELARNSLKLGPTQLGEIAANLSLLSSPSSLVLDRYTGVLFDGIDQGSLSVAARQFAKQCLVVHSALFGLLSAHDVIPRYRFSQNSVIPGFPLRRVWGASIRQELASIDDLLMIDLRSESYVSLGEAPVRENCVSLKVFSHGSQGGKAKLVTHFNKKAKGQFVRMLLEEGTHFASVSELCSWANDSGIRLESHPKTPDGKAQELALFVFSDDGRVVN